MRQARLLVIGFIIGIVFCAGTKQYWDKQHLDTEAALICFQDKRTLETNHVMSSESRDFFIKRDLALHCDD